jgi:hypothetical protein
VIDSFQTGSYVDGSEAPGTNHGGCADLKVGQGSSAFIEEDQFPAGVTYPTQPDQRYFASGLSGVVTNTTFSEASPGRLGLFRVESADWDEGTGGCAGAQGTGRQVRNGNVPVVASEPAAVATVTGPGPVTWDITSVLDTKPERFNFNGFEVRALDDGQATLHAGASTTDPQALTAVTVLNDVRPTYACIDVDPENALVVGDEKRLDAVVTTGTKVVNGNNDGCDGMPVEGGEVYWEVEREEPDAYFNRLGSQLIAREEIGGGDAGPELARTYSDANGHTFVTITRDDASEFGLIRISGRDRNGVIDQSPNPTPQESFNCSVNPNTCTGESFAEDDVTISWGEPVVGGSPDGAPEQRGFFVGIFCFLTHC